MQRHFLLRRAAQAIQSTTPRTHTRLLSTSASLYKKPSDHSSATTPPSSNVSDTQRGSLGQTNSDVSFSYPKTSNDLPGTNAPLRGHGGRHFKPTLASYSLEGKVAVLTGAARGLGLVMAQALMLSGADLAIVDLNEDEAKTSAAKLVETFQAENPEADRTPTVTAHYADVSSPSSVTAALSAILSTHSKIDVLVTSAGFTENFPAVEYPHERLRKLWAVNVDGTWLFAVGVAKHLMERKATGSMVFIGSMSGAIVNVPQPQSPYNISKAAVRHMAASLAVEWAEHGIRVNCISPGYMLTALTEKILQENPALQKQWTAAIPVGKMGRPQDLMGAVTFLASDASSYVTGADIRVDGGFTLT